MPGSQHVQVDPNMGVKELLFKKGGFAAPLQSDKYYCLHLP
jgi:hypothetical protein